MSCLVGSRVRNRVLACAALAATFCAALVFRKSTAFACGAVGSSSAAYDISGVGQASRAALASASLRAAWPIQGAAVIFVAATWRLAAGFRSKTRSVSRVERIARRFFDFKRDPIASDITEEVYMDVAIDDEYAGRIIFGLFGNTCPQTVENFKAYCKGGWGRTYKQSPFHRIIPGFMVQGGDIVNGNGTGGKSIYGRFFNDENFFIQHSLPGMLSMANQGPNSNASQFFVTVAPDQNHLDGYHCCFGMVLEGAEVVAKMAEFGDASGNPTRNIRVCGCGLVLTD